MPVAHPRSFVAPEDLLGAGFFLGTAAAVAALDVSWMALPAAACFAAATAGWLHLHRRGVRDDRRDTGKCIAYGYDLTANVSGVCPECGTAR